jgi:hypothetical protein
VPGCGYLPEKASYLQEVEGHANAFRMHIVGPPNRGVTEYVKEIRVFELQNDATGTNVQRLRWEMTGLVVADGFEVVVGQVPNRFTQVYPAPSEVFKPISGNTYEISIVTDVPSGEPLGMKTLWVAK